MKVKTLFITFLLVGLLIPPAYSTGKTMEKPGYLLVEAPEGLVAEVGGVGSYTTPVGLVLHPGNYTVRITGNVTVLAEISVVAGTATVVHVDPRIINDAVSGNGIVSIRTVLNESANYSRKKLNPPFNPLQEISGCGFGDFYINISKPVPMGLVERGPKEVYLIPNGTFVHLGDSDGRPCIDYVRVSVVSTHVENVKNATYVVPWARLEVDSVPENLTFYVNGGHNRYIFYTPMGLYVPAIPHEVYNATAVGAVKKIRIPVIHRLDAHTVGVGENHHLVEAVVRVAPNGTYRVRVDMEGVKSALRVERNSPRVLSLRVDSEPENASLVVTDGVLRAFANSPATLLLPPGNYTVIATRGNLSAKEHVILRENSNVFLKLSPANATLTVVTRPGNATVLLNGEEVKARNLTLSPGRYNLTVKAPGYVTKSVEVILAPNESKKVEVNLERKPAVENPEPVVSPSSDGTDGVKERSNGDGSNVMEDNQPPETQPTATSPVAPRRNNGSLWVKMVVLIGVVGAVYLVLKMGR